MNGQFTVNLAGAVLEARASANEATARFGPHSSAALRARMELDRVQKTATNFMSV